MIRIYLLLGILITTLSTYAQTNFDRLSLDEAIRIAHNHSPQAQMAALSFMAQYWNFRSYKAELLPSLNMNAGVGQYNRSIVEVRDPDTGEISYVANNTLTNDLSVSIDQNIALTGGKLSVNTNLARLDQFSYNNKIYNSNPITINYIQPIRSFNALKWQKRIAPLQYESAKRQYLESMENITIQTSMLFFSVLTAQNEYNKTVANYNDTKNLYNIAKQRFDIGTITKSELLQLELSLLNSDLAINTSKMNLDMSKFELAFYLGIAQSVIIELVPPTIIPSVELVYDFVLEKAHTNSASKLNWELREVNAQKDVTQAKAQKGLQVDLRANLGLSQTAGSFSGAYTSPKDREVVGITLRMPIYDWGMSKGKIKMAQAEERLVQTELEQEQVKYEQDIRIKVIQFNNQAKQCDISRRAQLIADERYEITKKRFQNGTISVTDLNTAQKEKDDAQYQYINQMRTFWNDYYQIQKLSLYDYINKTDISAEFDKIIEN